MSQIKKITIAGLLIAFISGSLIIGGCGSSTPNSKAPFDADSGTHPSGWIPAGHAAAAAPDGNTCTECHGSDLSGGISGVSCMSCHVNGSPLALTGCTSCHGNPPSGIAAPNRAGAHNTITGHFAPSVILPDGCNTCHNGAGSGTLKHDNGIVDISLLSLYSSNNGTAVHNADDTCSNVSCHGGQTTPNWLTGSIDAQTQCTSCHVVGPSAGNPEYNSPWSGQHALHVNTLGRPCYGCHDTTKLTISHFVTLNTLTLETPGSATLRDDEFVHYVNGSCTSACHSGSPPDPRPWF